MDLRLVLRTIQKAMAEPVTDRDFPSLATFSSPYIRDSSHHTVGLQDGMVLNISSLSLASNRKSITSNKSEWPREHFTVMTVHKT